MAVQKGSAKQAAHYVKSCWLVRLAHGVYAYPSDSLDAPFCILLLQRNSPGLHVGGKSALDLPGVRHNLTLRRNLDSLRRAKVPSAREVRGLLRITNWRKIDIQSPIWNLGMEITAFSFKLQANVTESRKRFPISQSRNTCPHGCMAVRSNRVGGGVLSR